VSRRHFLSSAVLAAGAVAGPGWPGGVPFAQTSDRSRPAIPYGTQVGEVGPSEAVIWAATDRRSPSISTRP
jgi:phosphodiesterase/alkaline phosphatase D-like protein